MLFVDRFNAALKLIPCIKNYKNENAIVYAIPGGGVPLGYYLSKDFNIPLELIFTQKIFHPDHEDQAVAVVNKNEFIVNERLKIPADYFQSEVMRIRKQLDTKYQQATEGRKYRDATGATAIIVDDGISTGKTMMAAIKMVRSFNPSKIVVAVPVAPAEIVNALSREVNHVICLHTISTQPGVAVHYLDYSKVSDQEINHMARAANQMIKAA